MSSENNKVFIEIKGARQNNLKGIDVKIPLYTFNVVCGPSGSGKSSLAFETLYAEGQRRYTETLSNYARQYVKEATKPLLDDIKNIPPPLLLGQKNPVRSSRSTVGTHSEVLDLLRIIFSKLGVIHCPQHKILLQKYSPDQGAKHIMKNFEKGFLLCPVEKIQKKDQTATLNKIRREGFSRIAQLKKNKLQIQPLDTVKKLPSSFFIVIDRLVFSDRKRISDSLAQCFATSIRHNPLFQSGLAVVCDFNNNIQYLSEEKMCSICRYQFPLPITPSLFSFNSTLGACNECRGFGNILCLDEDKIIPNPYLTIEQGAIHIYSMPSTRNERRQMKNFCKRKKININKPWYKLSDKHKKAIFEGDSSFRGIEGMFQLLENKRYKMHVRMFLARYKTQKLCPVCKEGRLRKETLQVLFQEKSIADWTCMTFEELDHQLNHLQLSSTESLLIKEVLTALRKKVHLINKIGLGYLQLNRPIKTLSGGEFQRLNLVHQISGGLSQVLYILDEPTVGLHSRDSERLIEMLKELLQLGNTVLVVEHDPEVIEQAEHIIEMGPGSGIKGGFVHFDGSFSSFLKHPKSITAPFLKKTRKGHTKIKRSVDKKLFKNFLTLKKCTFNNLKNIDIKIPLSRFVVCTGVSGSGKSSLVSHTLYPALKEILKMRETSSSFDKKTIEGQIKKFHLKSIQGFEKIKRVLFIDRSGVEGTQRSFVGTYMDFYTPIRQIMGATAQSMGHSYTASHFSINTTGGRCEDCLGLGFQEIEMVFMDPIRLVCDKCKGLKFKSEILEIKYSDKSIDDILNMTVEQGMDFFTSFPKIFKPLSLLKRVGLGYIKIGQPLSTLSGGESGRLKLARELASSQIKETFYIFDEPSSGLHFKEVELLLKVIQHLVDQGASVLLVEHNLQIQAESDYIIDLGPEAGQAGGAIVAQASTSEFIKRSKGASAECLRSFLQS